MANDSETTITVGNRGDAVQFTVSVNSDPKRAGAFVAGMISAHEGLLSRCLIVLKEDRPQSPQ